MRPADVFHHGVRDLRIRFHPVVPFTLNYLSCFACIVLMLS